MNDIFDRLRGDPTTVGRVRDVERVSMACLEWANHKLPKGKGEPQLNKTYTIPPALTITKLQDVRVPVMTYTTPVDPTLRYENCRWIVKYDSTYFTLGGINLPKVCDCEATDGVKYRQLVCLIEFMKYY